MVGTAVGAAGRAMPFGAELVQGGTSFRLFAPKARRVEVVLADHPGDPLRLEPEGDGFFSILASGIGIDTQYRYRLNGSGPDLPDPASRFQPEGPHGPSEVIDPRRYVWSDSDWRGVSLADAVFYELHIGTFTAEGTWRAARTRFSHLVTTGITVIEVMPVHEFPGRFGWGYDGVCLYAPYHGYGSPDEFRAFVDDAHAHGLGVILDVVYNHFGPDGNYLRHFDDVWFAAEPTQWGEGLRFDGEESEPVREFFAANAGYWVREFHCDGLRLDATQTILDRSPTHIVAEISRRVRTEASPRNTLVVAESETQDCRLLEPTTRGGYGMDAVWNDDFHHAALVTLTGNRQAYYSDYAGGAQELASALRWGYLYQGQRSRWQDQPRGSPCLDAPATAFVTYLENHDQVANSARGERLVELVSPARLRAMTALWLLGPGTPLFFQGQEFGSAAPFQYFADHVPDLAQKVKLGRGEFLSQFPPLAAAEARAAVPDPAARATFETSKVDWRPTPRGQPLLALTRDLLRLRSEDPVLRARDRTRMHPAILADGALALRCRDPVHGDRLLLANFGPDLRLEILPEPLLAPPHGARWRLAFSTEDPVYGGSGPAAPLVEATSFLAANSTALLVAAPPAAAP